ncbi:helix-turn-helix transcriptional regulator [Candidatus Woesearchaeota archaeon]|nr:helix-turn-helix transcriptional regulator [Candidatus Woesearchaeota archaeon]
MELTEERLARGISASSRRQILRLLAEKEMTVKDIAQQTEMSMSLTSRHLTLLSDLGLLKVRKESPYKYYSLKIKELKELILLYDKVNEKL